MAEPLSAEALAELEQAMDKPGTFVTGRLTLRRAIATILQRDAENARMRGALESIADAPHCGDDAGGLADPCCDVMVARAALRGAADAR